MSIFLLTWALIFSLVIVALAPDTPIAKALRFWLIETPAVALSKLTPMKVIVGLIVLVCILGWAMSAPEIVAVIGIGDLSAYLDVAVVVALMSAVARLKFVFSQVARLFRAVATYMAKALNVSRARSRGHRLRRSRSFPSPADDEPPAAWAFA